jgi:hypothetical protein
MFAVNVVYPAGVNALKDALASRIRSGPSSSPASELSGAEG